MSRAHGVQSGAGDALLIGAFSFFNGLPVDDGEGHFSHARVPVLERIIEVLVAVLDLVRHGVSRFSAFPLFLPASPRSPSPTRVALRLGPA